MSIEIEKKYRLTRDLVDRVSTSLAEIGAEFAGEDFEENTIYGGEVLERNGSIVRIRRTQDRAILTYKKRIANDSDVKEQIEFETEVSDADAASSIIGELELAPKLVYEKKRKTWRFRDVEIVIDELPFGLFMEIEGSITGIREVEMLLEIDELETEHETYPRMTARLGENVAGVVEARFR